MGEAVYAFVKRDATAEAEDQYGDDQAPEVQPLPVPERVFGRRGTLAQADADKQEHAIEAIVRRVNAIREHGRTAGDAGHHELCGGGGRIDGQLRRCPPSGPHRETDPAVPQCRRRGRPRRTHPVWRLRAGGNSSDRSATGRAGLRNFAR